MKKDTTLKLIVFSVVGLLILWLASSLLFTTGNGVSMNFRGYYGGEHMYMGSGFGLGFNGTISLLLMLLIKILFFVFVASLIVGLILIVKNNIFTAEDIETIKGSFTSKNKLPKKVCDTCGKDLDPKWKACPYCGKEVQNISEV